LSDSTDVRRTALEQATGDVTPGGCIGLAEQHEPSYAALKKIWDRGGEGAIVKLRSATYQPGKRSNEWVKFKRNGTAVLTIIGFEDGLMGPHSKIVARDAKGVVITVKTLNDEWRAIFATSATAYIGRQLVISFQQVTRDGKYRHPMADHILD